MEKIAISSTKGGVGKSSLTVLLAKHFQSKGLKIGIVDADIYGPNILRLLDFEHKQHELILKKNNLFEPVVIEEIALSSMSFVIDQSQAAAWRGPMLSSAIKQIITKVEWGNLDLLLIDMPPGTGDAYLTIFDEIKIKKSLLVAVDDELSIDDLKKTVNLLNKLNVNQLGIVENLSEKFQLGDKPIFSKKIKAEFPNHKPLFSIPRVPKNMFYKEIRKISKLKDYFPDKLFF
ncbi:ATP-binding protein [SAR86 cluster bacterium]|jgi:ATP-binding protein involved in chromosome partitioning|uniref:ATP-binding protein n=1 Tax=SAR86 cluster bacterium TaxID=2030880 RepID=A0A9Q8X1M4_9GAMM|nr:ATP-binding protein [SAR86 cluster bacterium]